MFRVPRARVLGKLHILLSLQVPKSRFASFITSSAAACPSIGTPFVGVKSRLGVGTPSKTPGQTPRKAWAGTPVKTPRSAARPLGTQECLLGTLHDSYKQLCRQVKAVPSSYQFRIIVLSLTPNIFADKEWIDVCEVKGKCASLIIYRVSGCCQSSPMDRARDRSNPGVL